MGQMTALGDAIRNARKRLGLTQGEFGAKVGVEQSTVSRWEKGAEPDYEQRARLAKYLPATVTRPTVVSIVGAVEAGKWGQAEEPAPHEIRYLDLPEDPRYPGTERIAFMVRGPSMNRVLPEGSFVVCVNSLAVGRDPVTGEYVVVRRKSLEGLYEMTIKEFELDDSGQAWLWPRSSHPRFQEPLRLTGADDDNQDVDTVIIGLVVASYRPEGPTVPPPPKNRRS